MRKEAAASIVGHLLMGLLLLVGERCTRDDRPMISRDDVMMVSAVAPPKQTGRMPTKATRAPTPAAGTPKAKAPPPPPTASDMKLKTKDAPEEKGEERPKDHRADRDALLRKAKRDALLQDAAANVGTEDRLASDPDGVAGVGGTGPVGAGPVDAELAAFIAACRNAIIPNWTPLPATLASHPDYSVVLEVTVAADGTLGTPKVVKSSGDASFDKSGIMAVMKTRRLPAPPEKYRDSAASGVQIFLNAKDK